MRKIILGIACIWLSGCAMISNGSGPARELKDAEAFAKEKNYAEAAAAYRHILSASPHAPQAADALFELSLMQVYRESSQRDIAKALRGFEEFINRYPGDERIHEAHDLVLILKIVQELKKENERLRKDIEQLKRLDIRHEERRSQ